MSRRVKRRYAKKGRDRVGIHEIDDDKLGSDDGGLLDWTRLPDDTVIQLFSCLNYRDRASLSSTCRAWRALGKSPCLWQALDIRAQKFDASVATSLSSRCESLHKIRFRGPESANAIINLRARNLREIIGDSCGRLNDASLSMLAARHEALECITLGPDYCDWITSEAIRVIAICCPRLKKLRVSGLRNVNAVAINALANNCSLLTDVGFIDCTKLDEYALGNLRSVRFLSVAGTDNILWDLVLQHWTSLPNLTALDVSDTDIDPSTVTRFISSSASMKVMCALNCPSLEEDTSFASNKNLKGKVLLSVFTDILKAVAALVTDTPKGGDGNRFLDLRRNSKVEDKRVDEILNWLEFMISVSLPRVCESKFAGLENFWLNQGISLLLDFVQSQQEEVQEKAAMALATFVVIDDENASIDTVKAEAVMKDGGIRHLLNLACSWREGLQSAAAKAIATLSVNANVAKAVAEEGGIKILVNLARSVNRLVAEEAAGGLWNLSVGEDHKGAIAVAGGVKALVDLILKWSVSSGGEGVLERAAGALANLAADDKCSTEVASAGGVHALVKLARNCKFEGVQEQAARALANLVAHGDSNNNNAVVGQEAGAVEALVQLTHSLHDGVRQEAAGALWNLSFDDRNREAIAAAGGVEALVSLAHSCANSSHGLQERVAGALWGLSVSEANSIAIGQQGGVAPLTALAKSDAEDVHETAAGALWNLSFNPGNALRIVEEEGVPALVHLCSSSVSKMARFMSALALAYMFDGRMDEIALAGTSTEGDSKGVNLDGLRKLAMKNIDAFMMSFSDPQAFAAAAASSAPAPLVQVIESARIQEAGHLRCSGSEIGRFVTMLRNPSPTLKGCIIVISNSTFGFLLLSIEPYTFTVPGGRHAGLHVQLLQNSGATRVLRAAAASASAPIEAKIFARVVLRNLEHHHQAECSV
ncbi:armadillo/beta-catenin repeat family protein [Striga asiatica]|uniref:Armadillo/beta-catenin repeat family protein n=1 Tax=Striga asiatica TaxID=4170 RepID=A0A5A7PER0_STRAF|nr:armadillo/beta-catenin repeat family protein [Striga asiatica]